MQVEASGLRAPGAGGKTAAAYQACCVTALTSHGRLPSVGEDIGDCRSDLRVGEGERT